MEIQKWKYKNGNTKMEIGKTDLIVSTHHRGLSDYKLGICSLFGVCTHTVCS
jgi:hypothetical protein